MGTVARRERLRLLLADDCPELIQAVLDLLQPHFAVVRSVSDGNLLVDAAGEIRPDVVISDFNMPGMNGIDAGASILRQGFSGAVILLTVYNDITLVRAAVQAGILGYVLKGDAGEELPTAVERVAAGKMYLSQSVARNRP